MLRVLQINKLYPPHIGGVEQVTRQIAEGLKDQTEMSVLVCRDKGPTVFENVNGVKICRAASLGIFFSMPVSLRFFGEYKKQSKDKDIIHIHMPFPLADLAVFLLGFKGKIVVWWHSDIVRQKRFMWFYRPFMRALLSRANVIIVATERHISCSAYLPAYREKCVVIPYGVDHRLRGVDLRLQQNFGQDVFTSNGYNDGYNDITILFIGRLIYYKGCEVLLEAMKNVVGAKLRIVGSGTLEAELKKKATQWGIDSKVTFIPHPIDQDLSKEFAGCDIFVLPSVAESEAFGLVQIEAMAFGKPVINTDLASGVPYVSLNGVTGITVTPGDVPALTEAMQKLIDDAPLRRQYGQAALARVEDEFSEEKMLSRILRVYEELCVEVELT